MPAGRPPKPIALHEAQGTFRKDRHAKTVDLGRPDVAAPSFLVGLEKKEWSRVAPILAAAGLLRDADHAMLAAYCEAYAEFVEAKKMLKKKGRTFTTDKGYVSASPWVAIKNNAADRMGKFAAHFGLSPASRARVPAPEAKPEKPSGKARFFNGA